MVQSKEFQVKKPRGSLLAGVPLEFDVPLSRDRPQPGKCRGSLKTGIYLIFTFITRMKTLLYL